MYTLVSVIVILIILVIISALYSVFKVRIHFFVTGMDAGFSFPDLVLLWNVSQLCKLENPSSLFFSLASLTKCMSHLTNQFSSEGTTNNEENQKIMSKLFDYRTKIQNESDEKKGMVSTLSLDKGQKIRIILPGKGVFASEIVNNGSVITVTVPRQKDLIPYSADEWVNKVISVYLWKKGDARYVFDTTVLSSGLFLGKPSLQLRHSNNLLRTQKRKAVRAKCEIPGHLFIVRKEDEVTAIETKNGFRCMLEDVSESGALIRIGGKGVENIKIKLQYTIQNMLILMFGIVRTVEYNKEKNQSLLHFECISIEPAMRNAVLSYVYNMIPDNEKEVIEAINQTDDDLEENANGEKKNDSGEAPVIEPKDGVELENQLAQMQNISIENKMPSSDAASPSGETNDYLAEVKVSEDENMTTIAVAK